MSSAPTTIRYTTDHFRKKHYLLMLLFLILYGSVAPFMYTVVSTYLSEHYFTLDLISPESFTKGNWYTLCATFLMLHAAYIYRPTKPYRVDIKKYEGIYQKYQGVLFYSAFISLSISISLDLFYGRAVSNLTAVRPIFSTYLGYVAAMFSKSAGLVILSSLFFHRKLNKPAFIIVLLILTQSVTSWSRSGIFDIAFFILVGLAYSCAATSYKLKGLKIIMLLGVVAVILGNMGRGNAGLQVFGEGLARFYQNNQALYMAVENPEKMKDILLKDEPRVLFQQLFSFAIERTEYPSSFRLLEYWGDHIAPDDRGHIAGYAYGWLGLTFGTMGWYGLIAIYLFFIFCFSALLRCAKRPTLINLMFFGYFSNILYEFFQNLGLDSFGEKIFKMFIYLLVYMVIIKVLGSLTSSSTTHKKDFSLATSSA